MNSTDFKEQTMTDYKMWCALLIGIALGASGSFF